MKNAIHYQLVLHDPAAHLFAVTLTMEQPAPDGQRFLLPAWIPGSYMVRDFARNIVRIRAEAGGRPVALTKLDKHSWQAAPCTGTLTLRYEVYAWDLSVRAAHFDQSHAFLNGSSLFLRAAGHEQGPHVVDLKRPAGARYQNWRVATALPELGAPRYGFGSYCAGGYDELIDHPLEIGEFALAGFEAHGVPHDVVISGQVPNLDLARLCADLRKICESQIALFEPHTRQAPLARYVFLVLAVGEGYGGLEHRASTALLCARANLPVAGRAAMGDGYRDFLGLCSHEYFHTWNVKRIKPAAFAPYDLQGENYTSLLWLFEGFTSYYDDLILVRSGVIDQAAYLKLVAKTVNSVLRGSGRAKQSVAESSFDAWTKYYRQDENAPNAIVSYYTKGSLVALALDLTIRAGSGSKKSLDDVMRMLWQRYGRDFYAPDGSGGRGVTEAELLAVFDAASGLKLGRMIRRYAYGTADLPLARLLAPFGVKWTDASHLDQPSLGVRTVAAAGDCKLANVYEGGAAHRAGLSAGDLLVAIDGLRATVGSLDVLLARYRIGDSITLLAFRRDELLTFTVVLTADAAPQVSLTAPARPAPLVKMRAAWLKPALF